MVTAAFPNPGYEMFVDGAWTTITSDMYVEGGTTYARGRRAEGSSTDYGSATLHLKNLNGKYSNRNPASPYYGKIGRNTPFRQSLQVPDHFFPAPEGNSGAFQCVDNAAIDITGDIDMRVEIAPKFWVGYSSTLTYNGFTIATKWSPPSDKSWYWGVASDGRMEFGWSSDGNNTLVARSTEPLRASPGARLCLRVTLDVNNGASGNTATFYTSNSMTGTWDQLGVSVVQSGTTSIYNSGTAMWVGNDSTSPVDTSIERKFYRYELRNGINGTVVANPDWTGVAAGFFSFNDTAGRNWSPTTSRALIVDRVYRFVTEGSEWSPRWGIGGKKVITPVETSGIMRRLSQSTAAMESTLRHRILNWVNPADAPQAYWPMEDGKFTALSKSPLPGVSPLAISNMKMGDDDTCPPSAALPTLTSASVIEAPVPIYTPSGSWTIEMIARMDSAPSNNSTLFEFTTTAASPWTIWRMQVSSGLMQLVVESGDGATTLVFATSNPPGMFGVGWVKFTLFAIESGANLFCVATWQPLAEMGTGVVNANSATINTATAGRINYIKTAFGKDLSGASIGHLAVYRDVSNSDDPAENAFNGDIAGTRMMNLSAAQGIPFYGVGRLASEEPVGYQRALPYMTLMREAEQGDGGALCEDRAAAGLVYRDRASMYTQKPALIIPYGHLTAPIEPTDDDQRIRNRTTVQRKDGASSTVELSTGAMSVQDFPNGVGPYDQSVTLSLEEDSRTETIAGWLNHLGTWDEARYPKIRLLLHDHPEYIKDVIGIDTGAIIRITGTPAWLPPGPIDLMVEGYEETTRPHWWEITFSCSPAGPWNVAIAGGDGNNADNYGRADTSGSVIGRTHTATDNTLIVATTQPITRDTSAKWTENPAHLPMNVLVGGELVTVGNVAPLTFDNFGRVTANGWGTSDAGHTWSLSGGANSERSTNGSIGIVTSAATTTLRRQTIVGESAADCEISCIFSVSQTATGASLTPAIMMRVVDSSNNYRLRMHFTTGGNTNLSVTRNTTQIGSNVSLGFTYAPGDQFNVRARLVGHRILGKAWPITAGEPVEWQISEEIDVASGRIDVGDVGLGAVALGGNTNVNPEFRFDSFLVYNPQRFYNCTRSVNGIVKGHTVNQSAVKVAKPAIAAL